VVCGLLLFYSQSDFQNAFNREATQLFGAPANAHRGTIDAASKTFGGSSFSTFAVGPVLLLLPWLAFYLLWPNWGATLYGEVRGAKDIRKPFWSMFAGLWVTVAMVAIVVLLINKTIGWNFYQSANAAYWNNLFAVQGAAAPPVPIWPYPVMFAGFLVATAVLALTFLATVVAAVILPWRRKDLYDASPIARYKIAGVPAISVVGVITGLFLLFMLYQWSFNPDNLYGTSLQKTPNS